MLDTVLITLAVLIAAGIFGIVKAVKEKSRPFMIFSICVIAVFGAVILLEGFNVKIPDPAKHLTLLFKKLFPAYF